MATAYVTIAPVVTRDVFTGKTPRSEVVTTSGTAASGAIVAGLGDIAQVFCATAVYARSGGTVTPATGVYCPADTASFIAMTEGDVISLIDV